MRCILQDERIAVLDDFLPRADFEAVWTFVQAQRYRSVHEHGWDPVWGLHEGEPLACAAMFSGAGPDLDTARARQPGVDLYVYPTATHVDRLFESVALACDRLAGVIGRQGVDWSVFTARAFLYSMHTSLRWHTDHGPFTGAFTFFAHPHWNSAWGGELQVADLSHDETPDGSVGGSALDNRAESELLLAQGTGRYLVPKPNRLVAIKAGTPHAINHVHTAAGANVRCSIAGFFLREAAPGESAGP